MLWKRFLPIVTSCYLLTSALSCASTHQDKSVTSASTPRPNEAATAIKSAEIITKEVTYGTLSKKNLIGYLAYPKFTKNAPSVLVVHEWWGQTEYPRQRAEMLARLGYVAMAVDMYGERAIADHPRDAQKFVQATMQNIQAAEAAFQQAMDYVNKLEFTDPKRQAAIGYCFGGGVVLHMARQGYDLAGVASFHGSLGTQTPAKAGQVKAKVLVLNGAKDPMVSNDQIQAFKDEMQKAQVDYNFVNYPSALHGFTNPEATAKGKQFKLPLAYDESADQSSWQQLRLFLVDIF